MSNSDRIGLDIGGTTLKAVRVEVTGKVGHRSTRPAGGAIAREALLAAVDAAIADAGGLDGVARIGIAVGGVVRRDGSMPADATNLPNLAELQLTTLFAQRFGRPCHVLNDAHAAIHGEAWRGAARGFANAMMVTFGTGLGGGLLLDGNVRLGARGRAGEIGAWPLPGGPTVSMLEEHVSPVRFERRHGRPLVDAVLDAARDLAGGEALAAIGRALASVHMLLDLEAILIGGGFTAAGEPLRAAIEGAIRQACPAAFQHGLSVRLGELGPYAGAIGAVAPTVSGPDA